MSNVHAVVGTGSAPKSVITEGLRDILKDGDTIAIPWYGIKPLPKGLEIVYDYVLDEEISFVLVSANGTTVPKMFNVEHGSQLTAANVNTKLLRAVEAKGSVLVLVDADDEDAAIALVERAYETVSEKTLVLDLTNGLAPVSVADDDAAQSLPIPNPDDDDDDNDDDTPTPTLTRAELESMPVGTLKVMAKDKGLPTGVLGKVNYIRFLLGEELPAASYPPGDEPTSATPAAEAPKKPRGRAKAAATEPPPTLSDSDLTQPPPSKPVVIGIEELRLSLYNQTPSDEQIAVIEAFREAAFALGEFIVEHLPIGRNRSITLTHLEDVVMRGVKSIILG